MECLVESRLSPQLLNHLCDSFPLQDIFDASWKYSRVVFELSKKPKQMLNGADRFRSQFSYNVRATRYESR